MNRWLVSKWVTLTVLSAGVAGCSHTFNVTIASRTSAERATALVTATAGHPGGEMSVTLDGERYSGTWVYVAQGGGFGIAYGSAYSGAIIASGTATSVSLPVQGNGSALLTADDGSTLRCVFNYSAMSRSGLGICKDNKGRVYDLQIA